MRLVFRGEDREQQEILAGSVLLTCEATQYCGGASMERSQDQRVVEGRWYVVSHIRCCVQEGGANDKMLVPQVQIQGYTDPSNRESSTR